MRPTLSVLLTPAATGGSRLRGRPGHTGPLQNGFLGIFVVMLIVQAFLFRDYRELPFGITFRTFALPVAASANYAIRWLGSAPFAGSVAVVWSLLGRATAFLAAVTGATIRRRATSKQQVTTKDRADRSRRSGSGPLHAERARQAKPSEAEVGRQRALVPLRQVRGDCARVPLGHIDNSATRASVCTLVT